MARHPPTKKASGAATAPKKHRGPAAALGAAASARHPSTRVKKVIDYTDTVHLADVKDVDEHLALHSFDSNLNELEERVNELGESWETNSLFEDALEELTEDKPIEGPEACTPEECAKYRQLLRVVGPDEFISQTIESGSISARKLLSAFGVRPPPFLLKDARDEDYYGLLSLALTRELQKRAKLLQYNSIDDVVELLKTSHNIIVLTGAGISTSLGIPDFRSQGTGLYSQLEHLGLSDPQEVFDIRIFKQDPTIFYSVAKDILPDTDRYSPTHAFIALLQQKGKLLTNYSQNIDNLEAKAGVLPEKLIQCHGSFATATCVKCGYKVPGDSLFPTIKSGQIPRCQKCAQGNRPTKNSQRKRKLLRDGSEQKPRRKRGDFDSNSDSEFDVPVSDRCGVMKPDITFFGENLPDEFSNRLVGHDRDLVDLVIVIGTSLKVAPVSEVVPFLPPHIPQIYISRTPVGHINFDVDLLGDCDIVVSELCRRAGWDLRHEMIPENEVVDIDLVQGYSSRHVFSRVKGENGA